MAAAIFNVNVIDTGTVVFAQAGGAGCGDDAGSRSDDLATEIEMPPMPSRLLRISTEMLPERERFAALQEEFARKMLKMDLIDRGDRCPRIEVAFVPLGAVAAGAVNCTSAEFIRRSRRTIFLENKIADGRVAIAHAGPRNVSGMVTMGPWRAERG